MPKIILVGAGGLSTHLVHSLTNIGDLHIFDGDKYEKKNITRQHHANNNIGKNKAEVLAKHLSWSKNKVEFTPHYFDSSSACEGDILIAAVDNNDARLYCRDVAERMYIPLIMGMNEEYDPQAYLYSPSYKCEKTNPFIYASIAADGRDPSKSCTGELSGESNDQTALANTVAAGFVLAILNSVLNNYEDFREHTMAKIIGTNNAVYSRTLKQLEEDV
jgi:molybdopterin/thiamine biosynthesis adenylyltransferase